MGIGGSPNEWLSEYQIWEIKCMNRNPWKLPWFWKAGGGPLPHIYGFGYWSSGPESSMGDGLFTYHNLQGRSEKERAEDLVELQSTRLRAFIHWIKVLTQSQGDEIIINMYDRFTKQEDIQRRHQAGIISLEEYIQETEELLQSSNTSAKEPETQGTGGL